MSSFGGTCSFLTVGFVQRFSFEDRYDIPPNGLYTQYNASPNASPKVRVELVFCCRYSQELAEF